MQAYHNNPALKAEYLARVAAHRAADELIHGVYWEHGKGCAVGCTVHSDDHAAYERLLGIPAVLAHLEDSLFESLPTEEAQAWPTRFLDAIPVGADLSPVWPRFAIWLLTDPHDGVLQYARDYPEAQETIRRVAQFYEEELRTHRPIAKHEVPRAAGGVARATRAAEAAGGATRAAEAAAAAARVAWASAWAAMAAEAAAGAAVSTGQATKLLDLLAHA